MKPQKQVPLGLKLFEFLCALCVFAVKKVVFVRG